MKATNLLIAILLPVALNSCKVHKEMRTSAASSDSTATSSKGTAKGSTLLQQIKNNTLGISGTIGQNKYQRQTVAYNFTPDTSAKGLQNRLTGITVTNEQGTQATQTGNLTRQSSDLLNVAKDSSTSEEKKNTVVNKTQVEQQSETTRTGGYWPWWLVLLIIVLIALAILKGRPVIDLIGWIRKVKKEGMPNTP